MKALRKSSEEAASIAHQAMSSDFAVVNSGWVIGQTSGDAEAQSSLDFVLAAKTLVIGEGGLGCINSHVMSCEIKR